MPALRPRLELRGEFTHFYDPVPLLPSARGDGHLEVALSAPAGVYRYKLRDDQGGWHLDPHNPRTASRDGLRDSVLCLGGTTEPLLHAPAPPWCFVRDDGRLCVRAALRRGAALGIRGAFGRDWDWRTITQGPAHTP